jgi:co-chaperonin GroES (HSP10)
MPVTALKQTEFDPKREILDKIGDISLVEIAQNEVLIAVYRRPEKTAGGIVLPASNLKEDQYQGKVGLVLKIGGACRFEREDSKTGVKYGIPIAIYDWIVVRPSDTWPLEFNARPDAMAREDFLWCRLVFDDQIRMRIPDPRMVW